MRECIKNLYLTNEYIIKNPSLHKEDSSWKVSKIIPLIDIFISYFNKNEINLLDAGGGAGLILNMASTYIKEDHNTKVNKFALDLSPGMLEIQKQKNPNLKKALNEDICKTSLGNKEIDVTLAIDLLEHVPYPIEALKELRRISKFIIFKVPLEDNLFLRIRNFLNSDKPKQYMIKTVGHINIYNFHKLKCQIEKYTGRVLNFYFTNVFDYYNKNNNKMKIKSKFINFVASYLFKLSPYICSLVFNDFVMILVRCY